MIEFIELHQQFFTSFSIVLITVIVGFVFRKFFKKGILDKADRINGDPTNYKFFGHSVTALIYLVGIGWAIYEIPSLKAVATSLLAGAGILAVVVGFASQQALSNIIAGIFIVMFKPFRVNERISLQDKYNGIIEDITLRHTVIRNFENRRIIIPNSVISNEIIVNSDIQDDKICKFINFGISYDSDIDKAKTIIKEEILNHPFHLDNRTEEEKENNAEVVIIRVVSLGDSSVNLRAWAWAEDSPSAFMMDCEVMESVKKRFDKEGIEIPFPHRTIVQKNPK